jgi:hypothetical protein
MAKQCRQIHHGEVGAMVDAHLCSASRTQHYSPMTHYFDSDSSAD